MDQFFVKITLMSRCFYRKLEANSVAFLPEGLFDNLIDLQVLWANSSLSSLFSHRTFVCFMWRAPSSILHTRTVLIFPVGGFLFSAGEFADYATRAENLQLLAEI